MKLKGSQGPSTSRADAFARANAEEKASARSGRDDSFKLAPTNCCGAGLGVHRRQAPEKVWLELIARFSHT